MSSLSRSRKPVTSCRERHVELGILEEGCRTLQRVLYRVFYPREELSHAWSPPVSIILGPRGKLSHAQHFSMYRIEVIEWLCHI